MKAQVVKCLSNKCKVIANGKEFEVSLRGKLKDNNQSVLVGDYCLIDQNKSVIESVLPRKNKLIRPYVANVDQIVVVISQKPKSDLIIVDQIIMSANEQNIPVVLAINKMDISDIQFASEIKKDYQSVVKTIIEVSAKSGQNIEDLKSLINGKLSVLVGESGVGKSSIINSILDANQQIGELSIKISRGKNTTRANQIFIGENETKIIDSPGFSALSLGAINPQELSRKYTDFAPFAAKCDYVSCNHISQPNCGVNNAVENGNLSKNRYERYCKLYTKYQAEWQNRYKHKKEKNNENFTINHRKRLSK